MRLMLLGSPVVIDAGHPDDRAALSAVFMAFPPADQAGRPDTSYELARRGERWLVRAAGCVTHESATLTDALLALEWQVFTDALRRRLDLFHVHGSALVSPDGMSSVLILGESGAGKTTLALGLMARGFRPLTDDVVLVDPTTLEPAWVPRAFHVDATTRGLLADLGHPPDWERPGLPDGYFLPSGWAECSAPVGLILAPRARVPERALLVRLSVPETTTILLQHSATLDSEPGLALRTAARLTGNAPGFAIHASTVAATAALVADTCARVRSPGFTHR